MRTLLKAVCFTGVVLVAALFFSMSLPLPSQAADLAELDKIVKSGKIKVGMELVMKKRTFIDKATNKPAGLEVDIFDEMVKRMGVQAEIIDLPWDGLIPALLSNRIDVICTGMFRLEKRALTVDFSNPMWTFGQDLMVRKSDDRIKKLADIDNPNMKVAVTLGGAGGPAAERFFPKAKIMTFPSGDQSGLALISGQVDAWCDDDFYHAIYVEDHADLKQVPGTSVMLTATGMAVRKGSDLLPWINLFLYNTKTDGLFDRLLKKWGLPASMNAPWDPLSYSK